MSKRSEPIKTSDPGREQSEGTETALREAGGPDSGRASAPAWEQRFRAARVSLPDWAEDAPERALYVSNATGTYEVYAWDRSTGVHRQVTDRPNGTTDAELSPDGQSVWWFDDTDGDEFGVWRSRGPTCRRR